MTEWTIPAASRVTAAVSKADTTTDTAAFNPFQAWTAVLSNIAGLQRQAWTNAVSAAGTRRPNDN